ncbi:MAG TPA: FAD-binding protein [Candidatus Limnocylindrales bacterium]|nr:FAD-binding protein [Candidatus Limnocylindrales bacterium]
MSGLRDKLRGSLEGAVRDAGEVPEELTTNFGHLFRSTPRLLVEPRRASDVAAAIRFARQEGLTVATRGAGHSQSHLGLSDGGILIAMGALDRVISVDADRLTADVEGGVLWGSLLERLKPLGLAPPVLTNNLNVTVGGTLSIAGIGVASFRHGTQGDQVEELDVVTGAGESITCGPERNPELFDAVIAGLGQAGVVTRARLKLRRVKPMTRTYYLLYDDARRFLDDARRAMDAKRWDHLESWASPSPQGTKPVSGRRQVFARWFYPFHTTVEFDEGAPPDDAAMLEGLRPYEKLYVDDLPTYDFFARLEPVFDLWKRGGTWEHVHAWMECVMPWETAPDLLEAILPDLPPSILVGGHVLLWPAKGTTSRSRLFMRPPGDNLIGFGILPAIPPKYWEDAKPMLDTASRLAIAMGGKRYLSGYVDFTPEEWREHFGAMWEPLAQAKRRYDPDGVLNPGFLPLDQRRPAAQPVR